MKYKLTTHLLYIRRRLVAIQALCKTALTNIAVLTVLFISLSTCVQAAFRVTTLAGSPGGFADGTGTNAHFSYPRGVAVDGSGNVYVADNGNFSVIRKISPEGVVTTLAGSPGEYASVDGTGSAARFNYPDYLAVDSSNNIFVTAGFDYAIRKITPEGVVTTLAGSLGGPSGSADGTGSDARFSRLHGIAVDGSGNVYVADGDNHTIRKVTPDGVVTTLAGMPGVSGARNGTGSVARFNIPVGLAIDSSNNLYTSEYYNHAIRKITPAGVVTTLAGVLGGSSGSSDGTGSAARFAYPAGLAVDGSGNVYVADYDNHTIRKVTPGGVVTTLAGKPKVLGYTNGISTAARFDWPVGMAVDVDGNLYVGDNQNFAIRKLTKGTAFVEKEDAADGVPNAKFVTFGTPAMNDEGHTAFYAGITGVNLAETTALAGKTKGIWADDSTGTRQLIVRVGDSAPGTSSALFSAMADPVYNGNEEIAFTGTLKPLIGDAVTANNVGIWSTTGGSLHLVARKASQAPGCPSGATFAAFTSIALPDQGGVVMLATLNVGAGGVDATNKTGIWAVDTAGDLQLIARTGSTIDGSVITGLSFLPGVLGVSGQSRSFSQSSGDLLYKATFVGGSTGIYKVVFP